MFLSPGKSLEKISIKLFQAQKKIFFQTKVSGTKKKYQKNF